MSHGLTLGSGADVTPIGFNETDLVVGRLTLTDTRWSIRCLLSEEWLYRPSPADRTVRVVAPLGLLICLDRFLLRIEGADAFHPPIDHNVHAVRFCEMD